MKHIGIVVPTFHIQSETFVVTEINALVKAGHKVSVVTFDNLNDCPNLDNSVEIIIINKSISAALRYALKKPFTTIKGGFLANKFSVISIVSLLGYGLNIAEVINLHKIEHLHCHFMHAPLAYAIVASRLAQISISSIGHGHDVYVNDSDLKLKVSLCNFSVAVCEDMEYFLKKYKVGQIKLLHCGVDLSLFNSSPTRLNEAVKLLFIGRLVEKKGLHFLLPALKKISKTYPISLDIVGDGPMLNDLKYLCEELNIEKYVRFLGHRAPLWLAKNTSKYSALIAPFCISKNGDKDTGPLVLKEAMASGIPVLTTELMGTKEIVNNKVGFKCEPSSISGLENMLIDFCKLSPYERYEKGSNAKHWVASNFNANSQAKKLSGWIQSI